MNAVTIILLLIIVACFYGAFHELIEDWWNERKSRKEFEKRQEQYKRMI